MKKSKKACFLYSKKIADYVSEMELEEIICEKLRHLSINKPDVEICYHPDDFTDVPEDDYEYILKIHKCFDGINDADYVVAIADNYHIGTGVLYELAYAKNLNKMIIIINIENMEVLLRGYNEGVDISGYITYEPYSLYQLKKFNYEYKEELVDKSLEFKEEVEWKKKEVDKIITPFLDDCFEQCMKLIDDTTYAFRSIWSNDPVYITKHTDYYTQDTHCNVYIPEEIETKISTIVGADPEIKRLVYPEFTTTKKGQAIVSFDLLRYKMILRRRKRKELIECVNTFLVKEIETIVLLPSSILSRAKSNLDKMELTENTINIEEIIKTDVICIEIVNNGFRTKWIIIDSSPTAVSVLSFILYDLLEKLNKKLLPQNKNYIKRIIVEDGNKGCIEIQWKVGDDKWD